MKKRLMKFLEWEHFPQVLFIAGAIPNLIFWLRNMGSMFGMLLSGFNLGAALYYQLYLNQRKRTQKWMDIAMKPTNAEFEEMFGVAKSLVEARMKADFINPDLN